MSAQYIINIEIFDHYPLILKCNQQSWGLKPFRVMNVWFSEPGFQKWVEEEYPKLSVQGWGVYVLKEKLKQLKGKLK